MKKANKLYVTIDLTDMTKLPSEVILNIQKDLKTVDQVVEEVKEEVKECKHTKWFRKIWLTLKSLF